MKANIMMASSPFQTRTYQGLIQKDELVKAFTGKPIESLRTPAFVIDRSLFAQNCVRMHQKAAEWGAGFRAHLKTHKVRIPVNSLIQSD